VKYKDYKINKHNSTVNGSLGRFYDWNKFCWDGSEVYIEPCRCPDCKKLHTKNKAPLPFVDDYLIADNSQYLHVPYDYAEQCTIYRVRPNYSMYAGKVYRGHKIVKQTAVKRKDGWYWRLYF
jgi:hypothetical protein